MCTVQDWWLLRCGLIWLVGCALIWLIYFWTKKLLVVFTSLGVNLSDNDGRTVSEHGQHSRSHRGRPEVLGGRRSRLAGQTHCGMWNNGEKLYWAEDHGSMRSDIMLARKATWNCYDCDLHWVQDHLLMQGWPISEMQALCRSASSFKQVHKLYCM